jgi:hypothetical protein
MDVNVNVSNCDNNSVLGLNSVMVPLLAWLLTRLLARLARLASLPLIQTLHFRDV